MLKRVNRVHCDQMSCANGCMETPTGGVCEKCPEWFEGDGVNCTDIRVYCHQLACPETCDEHESGGVCTPCPDFHIPLGDGMNCTDTRVYCKEKIPGLEMLYIKILHINYI